jgi:hypothetical protein
MAIDWLQSFIHRNILCCSFFEMQGLLILWIYRITVDISAVINRQRKDKHHWHNKETNRTAEEKKYHDFLKTPNIPMFPLETLLEQL